MKHICCILHTSIFCARVRMGVRHIWRYKQVKVRRNCLRQHQAAVTWSVISGFNSFCLDPVPKIGRSLGNMIPHVVLKKFIKRPGDPTRQLLPIMSTKFCSGDGERRKDKGGCGGSRRKTKLCVTKLYVKDGVWQRKMVCVCDKVVRERERVTKLCKKWCWTKWCVKDGVAKDGVWQSCVCERWWKMVCDKVMCERWWVTKWCVTKWCVKDGLCQSGVWKTVGDKVVCERGCVKDGAVRDGVWQSGVWRMVWWKMVWECVRQSGVWQSGVWKMVGVKDGVWQSWV